MKRIALALLLTSCATAPSREDEPVAAACAAPFVAVACIGAFGVGCIAGGGDRCFDGCGDDPTGDDPEAPCSSGSYAAPLAALSSTSTPLPALAPPSPAKGAVDVLY